MDLSRSAAVSAYDGGHIRVGVGAIGFLSGGIEVSSDGDEGAGVAGDESLEARVAREHEQLAPLFEATREALTRGQAGAVRVPLGRLRAALASHPTQEEHI